MSKGADKPELSRIRNSGTLFGAGLLGGVAGLFVHSQTDNMLLAGVSAVLVTMADYACITAVHKWKAKRAANKRS